MALLDIDYCILESIKKIIKKGDRLSVVRNELVGYSVIPGVPIQ